MKLQLPTMHCQNTGRTMELQQQQYCKCGLGLDRLLLNLLVNSILRFQFSISTGRTFFKYPYFGNADRCDAMVAELKNKAGLSSAAIRKVFEL